MNAPSWHNLSSKMVWKAIAGAFPKGGFYGRASSWCHVTSSIIIVILTSAFFPRRGSEPFSLSLSPFQVEIGRSALKVMKKGRPPPPFYKLRIGFMKSPSQDSPLSMSNMQRPPFQHSLGRKAFRRLRQGVVSTPYSVESHPNFAIAPDKTFSGYLKIFFEPNMSVTAGAMKTWHDE